MSVATNTLICHSCGTAERFLTAADFREASLDHASWHEYLAECLAQMQYEEE